MLEALQTRTRNRFLLVASAICSPKTPTIFRFIWTVESLRSNSWTKCDPGDSRQGRKQLEGLPSPVRSQRCCVSRDVAWRKRAEREASDSTVGRGGARDGCLCDVFGREGQRIEELGRSRWADYLTPE